MARVNPLEQMTEDMALVYVALVKELVPTFAPYRPWWTADVSADQQLWRWVGSDAEPGPRAEVLDWLMKAGASMGYVSADETLANIETIFTSPTATDLIPLQLVAEVPLSLLEMVQGSGPRDAGNHIRKMERMMVGRMEGLALLAATNQPNFPEPPVVPAPLPVELAPGTEGFPLFGLAPQEQGSNFGLGSALNLAGG